MCENLGDSRKRQKVADEFHDFIKELSRGVGFNSRLEKVRTITLNDCRVLRTDKKVTEEATGLRGDELCDEEAKVELYGCSDPTEFHQLLTKDVETLNRGGYKIECGEGADAPMIISKRTLYHSHNCSELDRTTEIHGTAARPGDTHRHVPGQPAADLLPPHPSLSGGAGRGGHDPALSGQALEAFFLTHSPAI